MIRNECRLAHHIRFFFLLCARVFILLRSAIGPDTFFSLLHEKVSLFVVMKTRVSNGSILPFAIAPNPEGDIFFLLGKEEAIPGWRFGSNRWADFGGGTDAEDVDMEFTSAREFVEETMAVIPFDHPRRCKPRFAGNFTSMEDLAQSLRNGSFRHKVIMRQTSTKPSPKKNDGKIVHNRSTVTYIKQIPWDPNLPRYFDSVRRKLVKLRTTSAAYHELRKQIPSDRIVPGHVLKRGILANIQYIREPTVGTLRSASFCVEYVVQGSQERAVYGQGRSSSAGAGVY
jgi:hypothetical protein